MAELTLPNLATPVLDSRGAFAPAWANFLQSLLAQVILSPDVRKICIVADEAAWNAIDPKNPTTLYIW